MDRREFLGWLAASGAASALPGAVARAAGQDASAPSPTPAEGTAAAAPTESAAAWSELMQELAEMQSRYLGPEWNVTRPGDVADGHRFLLHVLDQGIALWLEADPDRPVFTRIVSPTRKALGDNPDAVYYSAPLRGDRSYRIRGNLAGATYTSFTLEGGNRDGHYPDRVVATLNDAELGADANRDYELIVSPDAVAAPSLRLAPDVGTVTTRHYFERETPVAADPGVTIPLRVEPLDPPGPPPTHDDTSIAAGIRRVRNYVHGLTLREKPRTPDQQPSWVSMRPNVFLRPAKWDKADGGFGAVDNAYAMAPYVVMPGQALVIRGRMPACRFANVVLWNRFLQSYDYVNRRISLNRRSLVAEADGGFRIVIAHEDPGVPNWLDAEGRVSGLVYWRFMLPEGEVDPLVASVVPIAEVARA